MLLQEDLFPLLAEAFLLWGSPFLHSPKERLGADFFCIGDRREPGKAPPEEGDSYP